MISVGCIQVQKRHANRCPVGAASADEEIMTVLLIEAKPSACSAA